MLYITAFVYNNIFNYIFKITPFKYIYGYDLELHINVGDDVPKKEIPSIKERVQKLKELRQEL